MGQSLILDACGRQCAVTRERALPALEAAHIRSFSERAGTWPVGGLLLRSDVHRLPGAGYVTVTPQYRVEVSHRVREDFNDGESHLKLCGAEIVVPEREGWRPDRGRWRGTMSGGSGGRGSVVRSRSTASLPQRKAARLTGAAVRAGRRPGAEPRRRRPVDATLTFAPTIPAVTRGGTMPKTAPKRPARKKREIKDSAKQGTITRKEAREAVRRVSKNESSRR